MNCLEHWIADALRDGSAMRMVEAIAHCVPDKYKRDTDELTRYIKAKADFHGLILTMKTQNQTRYFVLTPRTLPPKTDASRNRWH